MNPLFLSENGFTNLNEKAVNEVKNLQTPENQATEFASEIEEEKLTEKEIKNFRKKISNPEYMNKAINSIANKLIGGVNNAN